MYAPLLNYARRKLARSTTDSEETFVLQKESVPDIEITDMDSRDHDVPSPMGLRETHGNPAFFQEGEMHPGSIYVRHSIYVD